MEGAGGGEEEGNGVGVNKKDCFKNLKMNLEKKKVFSEYRETKLG